MELRSLTRPRLFGSSRVRPQPRLLALYLAGGASARAKLDRLRVWLNANNATVMAVLLLVLGVVLLGQGLGGLFG
jgi:hypothetical protein